VCLRVERICLYLCNSKKRRASSGHAPIYLAPCCTMLWLPHLPMAMSDTVPLLGHDKWFPPWFTVLGSCFCYFSRSEDAVALTYLWISRRSMNEVVVVCTPCSKDTACGYIIFMVAA